LIPLSDTGRGSQVAKGDGLKIRSRRGSGVQISAPAKSKLFLEEDYSRSFCLESFEFKSPTGLFLEMDFIQVGIEPYQNLENGEKFFRKVF
jgi:hypothetical protein